MKNKNGGFIAITSVIIIGSLLALYILIDSQTLLGGDFDIERVQHSHQNFYNNESCANLKALAASSTAGSIVQLPDGTCTL